MKGDPCSSQKLLEVNSRSLRKVFDIAKLPLCNNFELSISTRSSFSHLFSLQRRCTSRPELIERVLCCTLLCCTLLY